MQTKSETLFLQNTRKRVGKAIFDYSLISAGDEVLVAVSGGKDSLFLLEALALFKKSAPINFGLKAIHIEMTDTEYRIDKAFLIKMCDDLKIPLHFEQTTLGTIEESGKSPCFICSWRRRKLLFDATKRLNCNKLALGHHLDDAIETLLMNMINHGNISSMPASVSMFNGAFAIIRPLLLIEESNIIKYAQLRTFPDEIYLCPHEEKGHRIAMKNIIGEMVLLNKNARVNLFRSMSKIDHEYLPKRDQN